MTQLDEKDGLAALARLQADPQTVAVEMSKVEAFMLLGQLQLALRHPHNRGPSSDVARGVARSIQEALSRGDPVLARLAEMGWDPAHDVPRAGR